MANFSRSLMGGVSVSRIYFPIETTKRIWRGESGVSSHRTSWLNYVGKRSCLLKSRMIRGDSVTASGCLFQLNREMLYIHKNVAQVTDLTSKAWGAP